MSVTQLSIYNGALEFLGETPLASTSDNVEARYLLDNVWNGTGRRRCLETGAWKFATRSVQIEYDTSITPDFGYRYAFAKPTDWVRTAALSLDGDFSVPFNDYADEAGYWWANAQPLYVKYVSDDASYGLDMTKWPESFNEYVESYFGLRVAPHLTGAMGRIEGLKKESQKLLEQARSNDAMNGPAVFPPRGSWARSRLGRSSRPDRARTSIP